MQINAGNESVVDIAEIVKNETETEAPINQAELSYLVTLVTNMTHLLEKQVKSQEVDVNTNHSRNSFIIIITDGFCLALSKFWFTLEMGHSINKRTTACLCYVIHNK